MATPGNTQLQPYHKENIQHNIHKAGEDQEIQRTFGISHSAQYTGSHIINQGRNHTQKINAHINNGEAHDIIAYS